MIPFVAPGGGQVELLNNQSTLIYDSPSDAVERIVAVMNGDLDSDVLRDALPDIEAEYGQDRFQREITEQVRQLLQRI